MDKEIEKAIKETLVISNPQSIGIAVNKIKALFESNTQEKECKHKWVNRSEYDERKVCSKCNQNKPHGF